jgi:hypothetical protein
MLRVFREMVSHPDFGWEVYKAGFAGLDVLFYAIAAQAAWRLAHVHPQQPAAAPTTPASYDPRPAEGSPFGTVEGSPFDPKPAPEKE